MPDDGYNDAVISAVALPLQPYDSPMKALQSGAAAFFAVNFAIGDGRISGIVKIGDTPVSREVRLYVRGNGWLAGVTRSAADGTYEFNNINMYRKYYVVALEDIANQEYNAVIADQVTPV